MFFDPLVGEDMGDCSAADRECVGDQRAMAAPVESLGAHDGGRSLSGEGPQLVKAASEFIGLHVVSEAAEARVSPATVRRELTRTFPEPSQPGKVDILECSLGEIEFQRLAVEMRRMPRAGDGPDIGKTGNVVNSQETQEIFKAACGVSDCEELSVRRFHLADFF